jgi:hypothetical protein
MDAAIRRVTQDKEVQIEELKTQLTTSYRNAAYLDKRVQSLVCAVDVLTSKVMALKMLCWVSVPLSVAAIAQLVWRFL